MKQKSLSALEQEIMDIVWQSKNCTVRSVLNNVKKDYAYTTIATILKRLDEKGLVNKKKAKEGYLYSPKVTKESYSKNIAKLFLDKFINSFGDTAIVSFADSVDKLPRKKRKYFLELLGEYDKNN